jgi:AraC-like DNA-binding protein
MQPPALVRLPRFKMALHHQGDKLVPFHTHDAAELVYTVEGDIGIDCEKNVMPGRAGILYILPANISHNQRSTGYWRTICVLYYHGKHLLDETPRAIDVRSDPQIVKWLDELTVLHQSKDGIAESVVDGFLFALLTRIGNLEEKKKAAETLHPRIAQAVEFLQEHVTEDVDAETLASAACASYSHLSALFRDQFGCAPLKYHQNLRLSLSQKLLMNPYASIDEVARKAGYEDTNYFVRLFRKTFGVPPGKWRRRRD